MSGVRYLAANDTDILQYNRDHYSYMWPRDGAFIADAMSLAGYHGTMAPFFHFCARSLSRRKVICITNTIRTELSARAGILMSCKGCPRLPIQEDETALVLYALGRIMRVMEKSSFRKRLYSTLVRKAASLPVRIYGARRSVCRGRAMIYGRNATASGPIRPPLYMAG